MAMEPRGAAKGAAPGISPGEELGWDSRERWVRLVRDSSGTRRGIRQELVRDSSGRGLEGGAVGTMWEH